MTITRVLAWPFKKTETQVFISEDFANQDSSFSTGSEKVENTKPFTYLDQVITNDVKSCFTQHRIERTAGKFYVLN